MFDRGITDDTPSDRNNNTIARLEKVVEIKEKERSEWAAMCVKKQTQIESLAHALEAIHDNLNTGNTKEAAQIAYDTMFKHIFGHANW